MKLYSYQQRCLDSITECESTQQLISMPTGTGKTITFLSAIKCLNKSSLILVHRQELLNQTYEKALLLGFAKEEIHIISSERKEKFGRLNIGMIQSLNNSLSSYSPSDIEMIVVDEAHHSLAPSYMKIFDYFKIFDKEKYLLGFTATPLRGDGKSLGSIYTTHSFKMTLQEATKKGYICPVHGIRINIKYDLNSVESQGGDYNSSQLDKVINCDELNELIAQKCSIVMRLPCLIFCSSVDHAKKIKERLLHKGKKAEVISYRNSKAECAEILRKLKDKEIDFLLNAVKLTEGFDHPPIQTIVIARPTRSPALYKQMIGRGLRLSKDKFDCLVIEFGSNDKKMICWDEIDSNSTFQCYSTQELQDEKSALRKFEHKFRSPSIKILEVRISPFSYYECKIQRIVSYKKEFRYLPFEDGFHLFRILPVRNIKGVQKGLCFRMDCYQLFWAEKYKSFSCFSYGELWKATEAWTLPILEKQIKFFANTSLEDADGNPIKMGRWYPSEEEPMSPSQRLMLENCNTNARKAEMLIENKFITKAIEKFWIAKSFPLLEEDERGRVIENNIFYI